MTQEFGADEDILIDSGVNSGTDLRETSSGHIPGGKLQLSTTFTGLYHRHFKKLVNDLRRSYGAGPPDPEEVAQRAFEKLSQQCNLDKISNPVGFAWVCARNIIISEKRAEKVRNSNQQKVEQHFFSQEGDEFDPERVLIGKEKLAIVMSALEAMPERRKRIFMLNRVHGLTPEQAGKQCGVSRSSAVRHIAVATAAIAQALLDADRASISNGVQR